MSDERDPNPNPDRSSDSSAPSETDKQPAAECRSLAPAEDGITEAVPPPIEPADGYQIKLQNFEGPLDLLLYLIKKKKVQIHDIPIAVITREYLEYLRGREAIDIDREAEFVFMAALLIYIKSQTLLPREQVIDPEVELRRPSMDHLLPYDRIKAVVALLRGKEDEQAQIWKRSALTAPLPDQDLDLVEVSLFDLAESFFAMMKRKQVDKAKVFKGQEISMADKTTEIMRTLQTRGVLDFLDYLWEQESLEEALISFFCLLELIKARVVMAVQEQLFNTIKVWLRKDSPAKDEE